MKEIKLNKFQRIENLNWSKDKCKGCESSSGWYHILYDKCNVSNKNLKKKKKLESQYMPKSLT